MLEYWFKIILEKLRFTSRMMTIFLLIWLKVLNELQVWDHFMSLHLGLQGYLCLSETLLCMHDSKCMHISVCASGST